MTDDERFTQDAISRLTPIEPSANLRRMVAQIPIEHARSAQSWWPFSGIWLPSLSMAAVAVLGLFLGRSWEATQPGGDPSAGAQVEIDVHDADDSGSRAVAIVALDEEQGEPLDAELEDLLLLATAGDFSAEDWDLSRAPESTLDEETF